MQVSLSIYAYQLSYRNKNVRTGLARIRTRGCSNRELRPQMTIQTALRTGAAGLALAASLAAPALADKASDTLTVALDMEVEAMNPYQSTSRMSLIASKMMFDTLVWRDPKTGEHLPMLATEWKWLDPTTIEFTLRDGVTFQNGETFDAEDAAFTLNFFSSPEGKTKGQSSVNWIDHAEVVDPQTIKLFLKAPFPAALEFLSGPIVMMPKDYFEKVGFDGFEKAPVGTGPYKVVENVPGETITFEANTDYFTGGARPAPQIGKIVFRTIPDMNTQLAELMTGGVEWAWRIGKDEAEGMRGMPNLSVEDAETMRVGYLTMNAAGTGGETPFTNLKVRQAIHHAINKQSIIDNLVPPGARSIPSACYPEQFGCEQDVTVYDYDPEKAKALLAEAGYPDGFEFTFDVYRDRPVAEAIIGDLAKVGIKASMNFAKYATVRDALRSGSSQMAFLTWGSNSIGDVSASTSNFFKGSADDTYKDAEVSAWLEEGDTSVAPAVRKEAYSKALKKIADEAYWVPLWTYPYTYAFSSELDFKPTSDEIPHFALTGWK